VTSVSSLKHYNEIRRLVPGETFKSATVYMSWHNRLTMTDMLEVWEALVVAFAFERRHIDDLLFSGVKAFLDRTRDQTPSTIEDCRARADELIGFLFPKP
jgi:hypothetical protein